MFCFQYTRNLYTYPMIEIPESIFRIQEPTVIAVVLLCSFDQNLLPVFNLRTWTAHGYIRVGLHE